MHIELLPGQDNVVRFPIEHRARPTLALMREIAPDVREVSLVAETFGLEPSYGLRHEVDARTAEYIVDQVPDEPGETRGAMLADLLAPLVVAAVEACRASHDASLAAAAMRERQQAAEAVGSVWVTSLRERTDALTLRAAELLLEAHARCQEAEGAARAVGFARRGEAWRPYDRRELDEWLVSAGGRG